MQRFLSISSALFLYASLSMVLSAQSVQSGAGRAPTNFSDRLNLNDGMDSLLQSPAVLRDSGGPASLQGISIRGARSKDVSVSLEGIPLNSPSSGDFDLGLLSEFGLGEAKLIRGGYSWNSSRPNGELMLKLPTEEAFRSQLGMGSYDSFVYGLETPFATFSYDQASNDYRQNNSHSRINARTWYRQQNFQMWLQILYVDLELPGPTNFVMTPSRTKTLRPTTAIQWRNENWEWSSRFDFQNQEVKNEETNRWYSAGSKLNFKKQIQESALLEVAVEQSVDKLTSENFSSDFRSTTSVSGSSLFSISSKNLIHPHLRLEFVSDLDQIASVHPGLGGRHEIFEDARILWNLSFIQRAPNFNEMYFEIPNFYIPNPELRRETSLQSDIGIEWMVEGWLRWTQTFFVDRKKDLLESGPVAGNLFQTRNQNSSILYGIETDFIFFIFTELNLQAGYTFQWSRVSSEKTELWNFGTAANSRQIYYLPLHKGIVKPILFPDRFASLSIPLYARSSTLANDSGGRVGPQFDLGLDLKTQALARLFPFEFRLKIRNLLGWRREETLGYPLPSDPNLQTSLTYTF